VRLSGAKKTAPEDTVPGQMGVNVIFLGELGSQ
jgi:hypothetical protein